MVYLLTLACGTKPGLRDAPGTGGAAGATQTAGSGGNLGTGGVVGSGGHPGTGGGLGGGGSPGAGGSVGSGGSPGTGGVSPDAGSQVACTDDGGAGLPAVARRCTQDSDCTIVIAAKCCGADQALGEAKSQSSTYASCLALPPGACMGLGCAKFIGYSTDTGRTTPAGSTTSPIDFVAVHCRNQLCTTDVVDVQDAGRDVAPVVDAAVDLVAQSCGDAGACGSGQACVLSSGGPAPRCQGQDDGGACGFGLVPVNACGSPGGTQYRPGCADPTPVPKCVGLADGCSDPCSCVCPPAGGGSCYKGPGYTICGYP